MTDTRQLSKKANARHVKEGEPLEVRGSTGVRRYSMARLESAKREADRLTEIEGFSHPVWLLPEDGDRDKAKAIYRPPTGELEIGQDLRKVLVQALLTTFDDDSEFAQKHPYSSKLFPARQLAERIRRADYIRIGPDRD